jgi:tyrosyl-tRNA synthetase
MDLFNELKERGLVFQTSNEEAVKEYLAKKGGRFYIGFDPTAESLHVGSLLPITFIKRLEAAGLKPIVLVGGATGLIGDPSGKSQERNLLNLKTVKKNVCGLKNQLSRFFNFGGILGGGNVILVDNYDWIKKISFIEVLRDFGKHFTLNEMISKESVQKRMVTGISFTEFTYMILQSIDFLNLFQKYNCKMQVGGSDQWGNMTAGIELIRKKLGKEGLVLSMPLVTKSDGTKFGKSEGGAVWLDAKLTSPYQFYQFWINVEDSKVVEYLKYYTFLSLDEIKKLEEAVAKEPQKREAQKALAAEMTRFVHGDKAVAHAEDISQKLFYGKVKELSREDVEEIFSGTKKEIKAAASWPVADFLVEAGVVGSKRQAREDVENKAIELNGEKISSLEYAIKKEDSLFGAGFFVVKRGKKDYHFVKIL